MRNGSSTMDISSVSLTKMQCLEKIWHLDYFIKLESY